MNGTMLWMALAGAELMLVAFVFLLVSWIRHHSASRRDHKAIQQLVARARKGKADRGKTIASFLSEQMGLTGEDLEKMKVAMLREELRLIQGFADIYTRRDAGAAARFQLSVEAGVAPYHALNGAGTCGGPGNQVDSAELEALRRENTRLSEELAVTMDTMSRMLSEYSGMFADSGEGTDSLDAASAGMRNMPAGDVEEVESASIESAAQPSDSGAPILNSSDDDRVEEATVLTDEGVMGFEPEEAAIAAADAPLPDAGEENLEAEKTDAQPETDPLEEGLGNLFDSDDLAVLDEPTDESESEQPDRTVAI